MVQEPRDGSRLVLFSITPKKSRKFILQISTTLGSAKLEILVPKEGIFSRGHSNNTIEFQL